MAIRLHLGLPTLKGKIKNYAQRNEMVEVQPVDGSLPGPGKLVNWRAQVPPGFVFSVVLPRVVSSFEQGTAFEDALTRALATATALQARCVVLATPPSIRPTKANRQRIVELAKRFPTDGHILAWQASGLWEPEDFVETAYEGGYLPIFDGAQEELPAGPIAYTRIRAMGHASQLGAERIAALAERLAGRREAFVVADAANIGRLRAGLTAALSQGNGAPPVPMLFTPEANSEADDEEA